MRLLTEDMPVPAVNMRALTVKPLPETIDPAKKMAINEHEPVENRNLQLARQVDGHKLELVKHLSRYPITGLWLMEKYDSGNPGVDSEEDGGSASGMEEFLQPLRSALNALRCFSEEPVSDMHKMQGLRKDLERALTSFPFVFEDLRHIVDLLIDTCGIVDSRGLELGSYDAKSRDVIRKRIELCYDNRYKKQGHKTGYSNGMSVCFESAMLPLACDVINAIPEIILTENLWLSVRQQLAVVNSKLVLFIANQYKGSFLDFEDLVQEGQSGLLKAVDRFKYQLGYQFSTYAGYWIRQAISRALSRSERVVRIPCGQVATINRVFKAKEELIQKNGREPSVWEIAECVKLSEEEVHNILVISQGVTPLESFDDDEDDNSFAPIDFVEQNAYAHSSEMIAEKQLNNLVNGAIKTLNAREAKIINAHFGMGTGDQKTLQQIGTELNLTRERVRQIQVVALNKIKMRYGDHLLSFL
jgi:RNA polymerase sigma factor (sigma-70 family)